MRSRDARWRMRSWVSPLTPPPLTCERSTAISSRLHPDRFQGNARLTERATQKTQEINAAYALIRRYEQSAPSHSAPHASHPPPRAPRARTEDERRRPAGRPSRSRPSRPPALDAIRDTLRSDLRHSHPRHDPLRPRRCRIRGTGHGEILDTLGSSLSWLAELGLGFAHSAGNRRNDLRLTGC